MYSRGMESPAVTTSFGFDIQFTYIHIYIHVHTYMYSLYIHKYIHICIGLHRPTICIHRYILHIHTCNLCLCMYSCIGYIHTQRQPGMHTCLYRYIHV